MGNIKTLTSMALIYTLTASVKHNLFSTTKRSSDFNHTMGVIGIMGYTLIDGASQIQGVLTHCNALRDGRTWCTIVLKLFLVLRCFIFFLELGMILLLRSYDGLRFEDR
jgi:hypothetical protein